MRDQYYSNAAYDFDLFMPAKKREGESGGTVTPLPRRTRKQRAIRKAARSRKQALGKLTSKLSGLLAIVFMVGACCGIVYTRMRISETRDAYNAAVKELERLEREEVRLNMLIENLSAIGNLEQEAAALGMQKPTAGQIRYISLVEQDKVEILRHGGEKAVAYLDVEKEE